MVRPTSIVPNEIFPQCEAHSWLTDVDGMLSAFNKI
jgi:hypothetical protein